MENFALIPGVCTEASCCFSFGLVEPEGRAFVKVFIHKGLHILRGYLSHRLINPRLHSSKPNQCPFPSGNDFISKLTSKKCLSSDNKSQWNIFPIKFCDTNKCYIKNTHSIGQLCPLQKIRWKRVNSTNHKWKKNTIIKRWNCSNINFLSIGSLEKQLCRKKVPKRKKSLLYWIMFSHLPALPVGALFFRLPNRQSLYPFNSLASS